MGEETMEPDPADVPDATATAAAFSALDDALWEPLGSAAVLRSQPQFDETVLDAWCGDGTAALPAAALVGPTGRVDAIDPDEALAALARERGGDLPQLHVQAADPAAWETGDYDLVQCVLGLASCSTPDDTARHLASLLRPGGRMVVSLWAQGALEPLAELAREALGELEASEATEATAGAEPSAGAEGGDETEAGDTTEAEDEVDGERAEEATDVEAASVEAASVEDATEAEGAAGAATAGEASARSSLPGTAGTLATLLHELGLVDVRAERVDRHLDLDDELTWRLVLGARLLPAEALGALGEAARDRLRRRVLDRVAEHGLTRVDASTVIAVGRRSG